jgi:hypothetical protein
MELTRIGPNTTVLNFPSKRIMVLFSYSTPVAALVFGQGYLKTDQHYSITTSKHINKWIGGEPHKVVSQDYLFKLANGEV